MSNSQPHSLFSAVKTRRNPLREMAESLLLLALAVLLFRTFAAEGYLISTGSMAPTLLGYHRRVECPACHFAFTRGAAFDAIDSSTNIVTADFQTDAEPFVATQCPNCSLGEINARTSPRNEGDQLLVQKLAYEFRDPHRWEVVVFQNQRNASQAYVKRAVGLPGEFVELRDGDLYVDGALQRKPFDVQRSVRIPVSDFFHEPEDHDPDWRSRWVEQGASATFQHLPHSIRFSSNGNQTEELQSWIQYEHWIRSGGNHVTSVDVPNWPSGLPIPDSPRLYYEDRRLTCLGTLSSFEAQQWLNKTDDPELQRAFRRLYRESHIAPVVDLCGYNSNENREQYHQHDLMLSLTLQSLTGPGRFEIQLTDGAEAFRVVILPEQREIALLQNESSVPLWTEHFEPVTQSVPATIDVSLFDQQIIVALNGEPVHQAHTYSVFKDRSPLRRPVRIGMANVSGEISELVLYRDIHYTPKGDKDRQQWLLNNDEFFVLGDNSPVSLDSRAWENPAIPRRALIGKPFVVHLPSKQSEFAWKGKVHHVRVPDLTRIRYIR